MKILRTRSVGFTFTGSYKKSASQQEQGNHYSAVKGELYRSGDPDYFFIFRVRVLLFIKLITKQNFP